MESTRLDQIVLLYGLGTLNLFKGTNTIKGGNTFNAAFAAAAAAAATGTF